MLLLPYTTETAAEVLPKAKEMFMKVVPGPTWPNTLFIGTALCCVDVYFNNDSCTEHFGRAVGQERRCLDGSNM